MTPLRMPRRGSNGRPQTRSYPMLSRAPTTAAVGCGPLYCGVEQNHLIVAARAGFSRHGSPGEVSLASPQ